MAPGKRPTRSWLPLEKNLRKLHGRGLYDLRTGDLDALADVARALSSKPTDAEKIEETLALAIDGLGPSRRDVARLWFGLAVAGAPDTRRMESTERHKIAWERWGTGAESTFRTGWAKETYEALAKRLLALQAAGSNIDEHAASPPSDPGSTAPPPVVPQPVETNSDEDKPSLVGEQPRERRQPTSRRLLVGGAVLCLAAIFALGGRALLSGGQKPSSSHVRLEAVIYAGNVTRKIGFRHVGVIAAPGERVALLAYYHDLESPDSGLDAINVHIIIGLNEHEVTKTHAIRLTISALNASAVEATTHVNTALPTRLALVPGSVMWKHDIGTNAHPHWIVDKLRDTTVTSPSGTIIDRDEQPCNNFSATVLFQAAVIQGS